ncbi:MAG: hypothetical protein IT445_17690 [Phycisphaeraceae bacterium]|nr:hypothetical protein [Phycisphaeraceae bacterium]
MWQKVNTLCIAGITLWLGVVVDAAADEPMVAPLVDATNAKQASMMVESWLMAGQVPPLEQLQDKAVAVRGLVGACVTLRSSGIMVGRGDALRDDLNTTDEPMDLTVLMQRATIAAFESLQRSLLDADLRSVIEGRAIAAPPRLSIKDVAGRVNVDVQLAYNLEPIRLSPNDSPQRIYSRFAPDYHGLLAEDDHGRRAMIWPANALAENTSPTSQLVQLAARLDRPAQDARTLGLPNGPKLWRFEVYHLLPPVQGASFLQLVRGNIALQPLALNEQALMDMAQTMAAHLQQRFTANGQVRGTYHPSSGRYDPLLAEPNQALLAAYALTRYVHQQRQLRPDDRLLAEINRQAQDLAVRLEQSVEDGTLAPDPATCALIMLTAIDNPVAPRHTDVRDRMLQRLLELLRDDGSFHTSTAAEASPVNDSVQALAVAALSAAYAQTRRSDLVDPLRRALDRLWDQTRGNPNINALPWLAFAQERVGELLADDQTHIAQKKQRDATLGELVRMLLGQQVVDPPRVGPKDVIGGFELSTGPIDSPPNPNWTSAPLLCFLSIATRHPQISGHDELGWLLSAALSARFLRQLQFDRPGCFYVRSPQETVGGIRLALWDNRLTLDATAMSLLAVTDLQETLAQFR